jgi:hypothetical protein
MHPFGVTVPAAVPQSLEIPEGLLNYPVSLTVDFSQQRRFPQIRKLDSSSFYFEFIITASIGVQNNERLSTI